MGQKNKVSVAMVYYLCPICNQVMEDTLIMNSTLTEASAAKVEKLHNKAVGYADHACKNCAQYKDLGIFLIEANTEGNAIVRTGRYAVIKNEAPVLEGIQEHKDYSTLKDGCKISLIDPHTAAAIGLFKDSHNSKEVS